MEQFQPGVPASQRVTLPAAYLVGPHFISPFILDHQEQHGVHTQQMSSEIMTWVSLTKQGGHELSLNRVAGNATPAEETGSRGWPALVPCSRLSQSPGERGRPVLSGIRHHLPGLCLWASSGPGGFYLFISVQHSDPSWREGLMRERFGEELRLGPCPVGQCLGRGAGLLSSGLGGLCRCVGQREGGV